MITLHQLIGQPAVSLATAEKTGTVKGVVVDRNHIVAIDIGDKTVDARGVATFDGDAFTYDPDHLPPDGGGRNAVNPIGRRVLTVTGEPLGTIEDLHVASDGTIERLLIDGDRTIEGTRLQTIGSYAAIVDTAELPPPTGLPAHPPAN